LKFGHGRIITEGSCPAEVGIRGQPSGKHLNERSFLCMIRKI
jgi:hypothetical protein